MFRRKEGQQRARFRERTTETKVKSKDIREKVMENREQG